MNHSQRIVTLITCLLISTHTHSTQAGPQEGPQAGVVSSAFTYQGQLQDNGLPANGSYDFALRLYDAPTGGTQLGSTIQLSNVPVVDGLFELQPDFGLGVFETSNLHLAILVRPGGSTSTFTQLLPRTKINPTPQAQHSQTADQLTNPTWTQAPGIITYGDGLDRALINRSAPITPAEYFGVHAEQSGFVGMYVSGPTGARPFYGYSVNGTVNAYTIYESNDETWRLQLNSTTPLIADGSNIIAEDNVIADDFEFKESRTNYASVMGDSFHSASDDPFVASIGSGGAYITSSGPGWLVAPVQLPHNAIITKLRAYVSDNSAASYLDISLYRKSHQAPGLFGLANVTSVGLSGNSILLEDDSIPTPLVNNQASSYQIRAYSPDWPTPPGSLRLESVVIEYKTYTAD